MRFFSSKRATLLNQFGLPKEDSFRFDHIGLYHSHAPRDGVAQALHPSSVNDLDLDEVFMHLDRTTSGIGQQYLYATMLRIPQAGGEAQRFEPHIHTFTHDADKREKAIVQLGSLSDPGAYFIQRMIFGELLTRPTWFWVVPLLVLLMVASIVAMFWYPPVFLISILLFATNLALHYWNKRNLDGYGNSIPQLHRLYRAATKLQKAEVISGASVTAALKHLQPVAQRIRFFTWENKPQDDFGGLAAYVQEMLKGMFLLEPLLFFRLLEQLDSLRADIHTLYVAVAEVDVALSLMAWRADLPYYCQPQVLADADTWEMKEMYHPLVQDPVSNHLPEMAGKSMLLSGSNMSGKTTYVRTLGISALLAQTLNTACAKEFAIPACSIHTAIRIADNVLDDSSYYYAEVKTIKRLLDAKERGGVQLFLLDELFKGTNTLERIASGKAVLSHLHGPNQLVLCATHDWELMEFLEEEYAIYHFSEVLDGDQRVFDYRLKPGPVPHTNAIQILERNGFPKALTEEAHALAQTLRERQERSVS